MSRMARKTMSAVETIVAYLIAAALIIFLAAAALWLFTHAGAPADGSVSIGVLTGWVP